MRILLLTILALSCFSANSLLCRAALKTGAIDAASFTLIRLLSGALFLIFYLKVIKGEDLNSETDRFSSLALAGYAIFFSLSYIKIDAGIGAFLLFGSVQATMIGWGLIKKASPSTNEIFGLIVALAGLAIFTIPGKSKPDTVSAMLMILAGVSWGIYSLRGKTVLSPLKATAKNFILSLPYAFLFSILTFKSLQLSPKGILLAFISGALTSGVGYTIWYATLPLLGMTRAAIIQLSVPVLALSAAVPLLDERPSIITILAGLTTLSGVGISFLKKVKQENKSSYQL